MLKGTVRNIMDFGAFVDIGVHQDGLVHVSEMSERFIKHPLDVVKVGDVVESESAGGRCREEADLSVYETVIRTRCNRNRPWE